MAVGGVSLDEVARFLRSHHGREIDGLEGLSGGFWSAAYGYRVGDQDLVARFGQMRDGFAMDHAAMAFRRPGLPVPEVLTLGDAFGGSFAISRRSFGTFLEDVTVADAPDVAPPLQRLFGALRAGGAPLSSPCSWYPPDADPATSTWRNWLLAGLVDDPGKTVSGWRTLLAQDAELDRLFERCVARVDELLDACPERRDLVHGDLLHGNVLVDDDRSIAAVFSWKCSVFGDFAFDAAWCTFWSPWHPGIAAADPWRLVCAADLDSSDRVDLSVRHHCYEVHIGATHLGWYAWTDDADNVAEAAARVAVILERGPLPDGRA